MKEGGREGWERGKEGLDNDAYFTRT